MQEKSNIISNGRYEGDRKLLRREEDKEKSQGKYKSEEYVGEEEGVVPRINHHLELQNHPQKV